MTPALTREYGGTLLEWLGQVQIRCFPTGTKNLLQSRSLTPRFDAEGLVYPCYASYERFQRMVLSRLKHTAEEVYRYRYVTYAYVLTNLKARYRRSILGFFWTVLAPMMNYFIMGLVFTLLLKNQMESYFVYYFSGAVFFAAVSGIMNRAPTAFIANEHYIKKIYLPKMIFVQNVVIYEFVNFFLSAVALIVLGFITGYLHLSWVSISSLLPVFFLGFFLFGLAAIVGLGAVYFRDLMHIVPAILQALFFATPIIYNRDMIPAKYHILVDLNPFSYFLDAFRGPLIAHQLPSWNLLLALAGCSLFSFFLGFFLIDRFENKIVFKL